MGDPGSCRARIDEEERPMPHYMFRASYSQAGLQGLIKEGAAARTAVVSKLCEGAGGRLIANYWAFGADDFIAIVELPDDVSAAAAAITVGASGVGSVSTTVLLTGEQVDAARAIQVPYRAPGA
jgi:uncharacterized protein with GYD domain